MSRRHNKSSVTNLSTCSQSTTNQSQTFSQKYIGKRTSKDVRGGKDIRVNKFGLENFDDYWSETEPESEVSELQPPDENDENRNHLNRRNAVGRRLKGNTPLKSMSPFSPGRVSSVPSTGPGSTSPATLKRSSVDTDRQVLTDVSITKNVADRKTDSMNDESQIDSVNDAETPVPAEQSTDVSGQDESQDSVLSDKDNSVDEEPAILAAETKSKQPPTQTGLLAVGACNVTNKSSMLNTAGEATGSLTKSEQVDRLQNPSCSEDLSPMSSYRTRKRLTYTGSLEDLDSENSQTAGVTNNDSQATRTSTHNNDATNNESSTVNNQVFKKPQPQRTSVSSVDSNSKNRNNNSTINKMNASNTRTVSAAGNASESSQTTTLTQVNNKRQGMKCKNSSDVSDTGVFNGKSMNRRRNKTVRTRESDTTDTGAVYHQDIDMRQSRTESTSQSDTANTESVNHDNVRTRRSASTSQWEATETQANQYKDSDRNLSKVVCTRHSNIDPGNRKEFDKEHSKRASTSQLDSRNSELASHRDNVKRRNKSVSATQSDASNSAPGDQKHFDRSKIVSDGECSNIPDSPEKDNRTQSKGNTKLDLVDNVQADNKKIRGRRQSKIVTMTHSDSLITDREIDDDTNRDSEANVVTNVIDHSSHCSTVSRHESEAVDRVVVNMNHKNRGMHSNVSSSQSDNHNRANRNSRTKTDSESTYKEPEADNIRQANIALVDKARDGTAHADSKEKEKSPIFMSLHRHLSSNQSITETTTHKKTATNLTNVSDEDDANSDVNDFEIMPSQSPTFSLKSPSCNKPSPIDRKTRDQQDKRKIVRRKKKGVKAETRETASSHSGQSQYVQNVSVENTSQQVCASAPSKANKKVKKNKRSKLKNTGREKTKGSHTIVTSPKILQNSNMNLNKNGRTIKRRKKSKACLYKPSKRSETRSNAVPDLESKVVLSPEHVSSYESTVDDAVDEPISHPQTQDDEHVDAGTSPASSLHDNSCTRQTVKTDSLMEIPNDTPSPGQLQAFKSGVSFRSKRRTIASDTSVSDVSYPAQSTPHAPARQKRRSVSPCSTLAVVDTGSASPPKNRRMSILKAGSKKDKQRKKQVRISQFVLREPVATPQSANAPVSILKTPCSTDSSRGDTPVHFYDVTTTATPKLPVFSREEKIIHPSAAPDGIRRSSRNRIKPLQWFRGERPKYERRKSGGLVVVDIISPPNLDKQKLQKRRMVAKAAALRRIMKEKAPPFSRRLSIHSAVSVNNNSMESGPIAVFDNDSGAEIKKECIRTKDTYQFVNSQGDSSSTSSPFILCKVFQETSFGSGQLILRSLKEKPPQTVSDNTVVFSVLYGKVAVTIHTTTQVLETGDMFFVPPGNTYSLKNLREDEARFSYIHLKS